MNCPCCHRSFSIIYVGRVRSISEMSLSAVHETRRHETRRGHVLLRMPCGYQGAHVWTRQIALKYKRSRCSQESQHYTAWLLPMFLCVLKPCATGQRHIDTHRASSSYNVDSYVHGVLKLLT